MISPSVSDDPSNDFLDELLEYRWKNGSLEDLYNNGDGLIGQVEKYMVDLIPGDLLYIPKRWLHDIESKDETVSLAIRFTVAL